MRITTEPTTGSYTHLRHSFTLMSICGLAFGSLSTLPGCASSEHHTRSAATTGPISNSDFVDTDQATSEPVADAQETTQPAAKPRITDKPSFKSSPVMSLSDDSRSASTAASSVRTSAKSSGNAVVLESHVGQVNGKPIFASEILEPLDGRLRALGTEAKSRDQWQRQAAKSIYDELLRRIRDELVLAEARSNLTSEQRQGLVHFLGQIQTSLVSTSRGSAVQADETLRENNNRSLVKETQDRLDRELIANEFRTRVMPRVIVPWRDVQIEYERNFEKYNPPPIAHLRMIILDTSNNEGIAKVATALAAGTPFATVAAQRPNEFNRVKGGVFDREFTGAYADSKFSEIKEINDAARQLVPGQTAGPVSYKDKTAWVYLDHIEHRPGQSLYQAQYQIEQELREERFRVEEQRYFDNLLKRGNVTKFEDMMTSLVEIATERYLPAKLASAPAAPARGSQQSPTSLSLPPASPPPIAPVDQ